MIKDYLCINFLLQTLALYFKNFRELLVSIIYLLNIFVLVGNCNRKRFTRQHIYKLTGDASPALIENKSPII